jgi:pimeloyl-ACP methyl ester carboxylesterase
MRNLLASGAALCLFVSGCVTPSAQFEGTLIHYSDVGEGAKAMVFVHGWACDSTFWSEQIPALTDCGRLIAIDLPGHGKSDKPEIDYSMAYWARCVDAVMRHAGVERAVLVGHSNGAPVIREFYRQFPNKTLALVTVDGALVQMATRKMMAPFLKKLSAPNYADFAREMTRGMTKPGNLTTEQKRHIEDAALRTPQHVMIGGLLAAVDEKIWEPDPIDVPVLMINAKQPAWNERYKERVRAIVKDLEYHELAGVNHCLMMDEPDRFNTLLRAFLMKHMLVKR